MVAVPMTEGQHLVEYTYRNSAFALGWKITLLSAAVFGLLAYRSAKREPHRKRGRFER